VNDPVHPVVRLSFPARPDYLLLARLALSGLARSLPVDADALADLKLAVTEACGNVVRHAYEDGADGAVSIALVVEHDHLRMVVEDQGVGIDRRVARGTARVEIPESGMGMSIMRAVVDELEIGAGSDGTGTVVQMRKYFEVRD
jgi:serine/threonine-protein kinase RsbW